MMLFESSDLKIMVSTTLLVILPVVLAALTITIWLVRRRLSRNQRSN